MFLKKVLLVFLVGITIYSLKIPFMNNVALYKIVFPIFSVIIYLCMKKKSCMHDYVRKTLQIMLKCWLIITVWGAILMLIYGNTINSMDYIVYNICFISISFYFSYYFLINDFDKVIEMGSFIISLVIGISGIYESVTGNFYHLTYASYIYSKNWLGLSRPNTIFYNVNDSATFMFMSLVIAFLYSEKCYHKRTVKIVSLIIFGGNIILTDSRGGLLGAIVFLYIYWLNVTTNKSKIINALALFSVLIVGGGWLFSLIDISDFNYQEMGGRSSIWSKSIKNLIDSYFLGVGPGNISLHNSYTDDSLSSITAVHNFFLEILCDYGIIGGGAALVWFISLLKKTLIEKRKNIYGVIIFSGLISFIPVSISSSSLIGKVWVIEFFGIIIAEINHMEILEIGQKHKNYEKTT